jgi:polyisoprenoid-binding protein YceI
MRLKALALGLLGFFTFAQAADAAPVKYIIDEPHTQIIFSVSHLGFSFSHGRFDDKEGFIIFDAENPANSSVEVTIEADSVDMGFDKWEDHIENADILDTDKYKYITFKSTSIDITGTDTAKIHGNLTIKDITKPVTLDAKLNKSAKHPMSGKDYIGFSATTSFKRSEFGINYGLPNVGDDISVILQVEAVAQ